MCSEKTFASDLQTTNQHQATFYRECGNLLSVKIGIFHQTGPIVNSFEEVSICDKFREEISANIASLIHHVAAHVARLRSALTSYKITA